MEAQYAGVVYDGKDGPRMTRNDNGSFRCHECGFLVILFDSDWHECRPGRSDDAPASWVPYEDEESEV